MGELSKTAKASVVKAVKEVRVESTEEAIKKLRNDRASKLFVIDMTRVDKLLAAYDYAIEQNALLKTDLDQARADLENIISGQPDGSAGPIGAETPVVEKKVPAADIVQMAIAMATIPSVAEDPQPFQESSADSEAAI